MSLILKRMFVCSCLLLSACAGVMNSDFSCNKTAGDSCLSIEDVDAMTRFADESDAKNSDDSEIWLAPSDK